MDLKLTIPTGGTTYDFAPFAPKFEISIDKGLISSPIPVDDEDGGSVVVDVLMVTERFNITATVITSGGVTATTFVNNLRKACKEEEDSSTLTFGSKTQVVRIQNFKAAIDPGKGDEYHITLQLISVGAASP
jgi:hypothetical protein